MPSLNQISLTMFESYNYIYVVYTGPRDRDYIMLIAHSISLQDIMASGSWAYFDIVVIYKVTRNYMVPIYYKFLGMDEWGIVPPIPNAAMNMNMDMNNMEIVLPDFNQPISQRRE